MISLLTSLPQRIYSLAHRYRFPPAYLFHMKRGFPHQNESANRKVRLAYRMYMLCLEVRFHVYIRITCMYVLDTSF